MDPGKGSIYKQSRARAIDESIVADRAVYDTNLNEIYDDEDLRIPAIDSSFVAFDFCARG